MSDFSFVRKNTAGNCFIYFCPNCNCELALRKRVTITKRRCPECNLLITPEEIDKQAASITPLAFGISVVNLVSTIAFGTSYKKRKLF